MSDGYLFKVLNEFGEEWIGDVFDDDAENAAAAGDERAGMGIREIAELSLIACQTRFESRSLTRGGRAIHGPRDRGNGDLGYGCNRTNVGEFAGGLPLWFARHQPMLMQQGGVQKGK